MLPEPTPLNEFLGVRFSAAAADALLAGLFLRLLLVRLRGVVGLAAILEDVLDLVGRLALDEGGHLRAA